MKTALALVAVVLLAGCLTPGEANRGGPDALPAAAPTGWTVTQHRGNETLSIDGPASFFVTPIDKGPLPSRVRAMPLAPSEPTIGATSSGALFVMIWDDVVRSLDGGRTWQRVSMPWNSQFTVDPFLHVDPVTDRIFETHLVEGACTLMAWSDDDGATWVTNPVACNQTPLGNHDHPKLVSVETTEGIPVTDYGRVLVQAYNFGAGGERSSRAELSYDGGLTWPVSVETVPTSEIECGYGLHGKPAVTAGGGVHIPKNHCEGFLLASSADSGRTWTRKAVGAEAGGAGCAADPALASDSDQALAGFWSGADDRLWTSWSADAGATWAAAVPASPPSIHVATMPAAAGRADGTMAVLYYGTEMPAPSPDGAPAETVWHAYLSFAKPSDPALWTTVRLTDDPVQVGEIDAAYDCENDPASRNLLDFVDLGVAPDGRFIAAFTDGCIAACASSPSMDSSRARQPTFASVEVPPG